MKFNFKKIKLIQKYLKLLIFRNEYIEKQNLTNNLFNFNSRVREKKQKNSDVTHTCKQLKIHIM